MYFLEYFNCILSRRIVLSMMSCVVHWRIVIPSKLSHPFIAPADDHLPVVSAADHCACTCALLPSTSFAPSKCQRVSLFGRVSVKIRKNPGQQLGLGIAGGIDRPIPPTVSFLRPGLIAHRCDQLQVGDRLLSVNGVNVNTLTHDQVLALLRNAGSDLVELELEYDLDRDGSEGPRNEAAIVRKTVQLELVDEQSADGTGTFGLTIRGGAFGPDPTKSRPLTVTAIRAGGAAHREGRLRVGDRLLAINGESVRERTLTAVLNVLQSASRAGRLLLTVQYDVCLLSSLRRTAANLLLEIEKLPGIDFGAKLAIRRSLGNVYNKRCTVTVEGIVPASMADRCGAIQIGDELLAIDGISLQMVSGMAEAYQLLRSQNSMLRLELIPAKSKKGEPNGEGILHMDPLRKLNCSLLCARGVRCSAALCPRVPSLRISSQFRRPSLRKSNQQQRGEKEKPTLSQQGQHNKNGKEKHCQSPGRTSGGSVSARLSSSTNSMGTICHSESMEVTLNKDSAHKWNSFGIVLGKRRTEECSDTERTVPMPLFIERIERGSPAEKSGVLQPGDRIISINEWNTADGTLEEAQHLLCACSFSLGRSVILLVEFSVLEPVLPPGPGSLFVVRLAKHGSSLGIVCRSEHKGAVKGEPLIISDIRMGSVAHRCGSIQIGDRIHSIDDIPLETCTLEESIRLLQRSAPIVKLCIAKGGGEEQDFLDASHSVIYSVQLSRKERPLGVTIASAGGLLDPIVISRLMPGGLADRTGALHVGDRIIAINGEPIEGKGVGQVTQLLQQCPDPLNIKLCRVDSSQENGQIGQMHFGHFPSTKTPIWCCAATEFPFPNGNSEADEDNNKMDTPLKSVDSAVDSMEDSPPTGTKQAILRHGSARLAHLRPSTSNDFQQADLVKSEQCCAGWDSGLSSAAATDSQSGGQQQHQRGHPSVVAAFPATHDARMSLQERCCVCRSEQLSCSTTASFSPKSSSAEEKEEKEDWVRILNALETVGEEEMLRKLEQCILTGQASNYRTNSSRSANKCNANFAHNDLISRRFPSTFALKGMNSSSFPKMCFATTNGHSDGSESARNIARTVLPGPQTPIFSESKRVEPIVGHFSNTFLVELPPPMPSPRPSSNALSPLLPNLRHNSNGIRNDCCSTAAVSPVISINCASSSSTFACPPPTESELFRRRCSSVIPFITSPTEKEVNNCEQKKKEQNPTNTEEEEKDQFDSEVFTIQLCRCPYTKSFGFSVCDGTDGEVTEGRREQQQQRRRGIYVKSVVKDGPADKSGRMRPRDRILHINRRSIQFLTCDLALPLLATDRVELLLSRKRTKTDH